MSVTKPAAATLADLLAIPEEERYHELIGGELIRKGAPSGEHGAAQGGILGAVHPPYHGGGGSGRPGGWSFAVEVENLLETGDIIRPDVSGWRRDQSATRPIGFPVRELPAWICEVLSPSNPKHDTITKMRLYHRVKIEHYWIVDPRAETLTVYRWSVDGYIMRLGAERGDVVRAEPFDAIDLAVGTLFGDDPPE